MELFILPAELGSWINGLASNKQLWLLLWNATRKSYHTIHDANKTMLDKYISQKYDDDIIIYIGNKIFNDGPIMRENGSDRQSLDFRSSLCIQINTTSIAGNVLLRGSVGTLKPKEYDDLKEGAHFIRWRNHFYREFKRDLADSSLTVTQQLADGTVKDWSGYVVSAGAREWVEAGGKLKEFIKGPVEFGIKNAPSA